MSNDAEWRRFDDNKDAASRALDTLRLRFLRAGFDCHQRAAKYMTLKAYLASGIKRPLINPRLGTLLGGDGSQTTCELEIIVYPADVAALGRLLLPFARRFHLRYEQLPPSASSWHGGIVASSVRVHSDGRIESVDAPGLDVLLRELHSALSPSALKSRPAL